MLRRLRLPPPLRRLAYVPVVAAALALALAAPACRNARAPAHAEPSLGAPSTSAVAALDRTTATAASAGPRSLDEVPAAARGMWVWSTKARLGDPSGTETLLRSCRRAGLNEVYLSVNNGALDDPRMPELVGALRGAGIRVEALMGDAVWYQAEHRAPMLALIEAVAAYDARNPGARIAGIHLDIEPHQLPDNRGKHGFLPALAETVAEATELARRHGLSTSVDLPRFALDEEGPRFARTGARPFIMLYQLREKTPAWLVRQSGSVLDHTYAGLGAELASRTVVGLRVEDYPADLETMLEALGDAHRSRPRYGGWAVHDEAKYRARFAR